MFDMLMVAISFPRALLEFARNPRPSSFSQCSSIALIPLLFTVALAFSSVDAATKDFGSTQRSSATTLDCPRAAFTPNIVGKKEDAELKVVVPNITTLRQFVNCSDPSRVRGFCIDVFEAALSVMTPSDSLSPNVSIHYTCFDFSTVLNGKRPTYDDMVLSVKSGEFDIVVGDVTIGSERASWVDFTQKYMESGAVIVAKVVQEQPSPWLLFSSPFSWNLWISIIITFLIIGVILCYLEREEHREFKEGNILHRLGNILWFMMIALILFERDELRSSSSRTLVMSWFFFAVLVGSSYTASLSAFLTANNLSSNTIDILLVKDTGQHIGYRRGSIIKDYIEDRFGVPEDHLVAMRTNAEFEHNLTLGPEKGGVIAIVDEVPYASIILSELSKSTCDFGTVGPALTNQGFGFGCNKARNISRQLSTAMMRLTESGCLQTLQRDYGLDVNVPCSLNDLSIDKVGLLNALSVFLPLTACLLLCIIAHYIKVCMCEKPTRLIDDDSSVHINVPFNIRDRDGYFQDMELELLQRM